MSANKTERLMNLVIMLLNARKPVTLDQIRETIEGYDHESEESFRRMFERDKEGLRENGIPIRYVYTDAWESEKGYIIDQGEYYLPELELSSDEAAALWLAARLIRIHDPSIATSALQKVAGPGQPGASDSWLTVDMNLEPSLPMLAEAAHERRKVRFDYRSSSGASKSRRVEPYALKHRGGHWYLLGRDVEADALRAFRMDRMTSAPKVVEPGSTGAEYEIPEGFAPSAHLDAPPFADPTAPVKAVIRFSPRISWAVARQAPWLELDMNEDGSATAQVGVENTAGFISWLMWYGQDAIVVDPPELVEEVKDWLRGLCG